MTFASDCCIAELVDERDAAVPAGVTSGAVLVTNLFNTVQPLIRYRLEDRFTRRPDAAGHGHLRADVEGRTATVLDFGGVTIHPLVLATPLTAHRSVLQYQVHQVDGGVDVDVVTTDTLDIDALTADLHRALSGAGLAEPNVRLRVVPALRRDSRSGKLATFVAASTAGSPGAMTIG
jgi:phenylacetate-coenzyme A ligase PaaK-like adenylate-forming protein